MPNVRCHSSTIHLADRNHINPGPGAYDTYPQSNIGQKEGKLVSYIKKNNKFPSAFGTSNARFCYKE